MSETHLLYTDNTCQRFKDYKVSMYPFFSEIIFLIGTYIFPFFFFNINWWFSICLALSVSHFVFHSQWLATLVVVIPAKFLKEKKTFLIVSHTNIGCWIISVLRYQIFCMCVWWISIKEDNMYRTISLVSKIRIYLLQ